MNNLKKYCINQGKLEDLSCLKKNKGIEILNNLTYYYLLSQINNPKSQDEYLKKLSEYFILSNEYINDKLSPKHIQTQINNNQQHIKYIKQIINKLYTIYNLFKVTTKNNLIINKIKINEKENIIFKCKFRTQKIIFVNKKLFINNMQDLHYIYWEWVDNNNIKFNRQKFIDFCALLWKKEITTDYSHIIGFKHIYNKYKYLEKSIPASYALILNNISNFNINNKKCLLIRHYDSDKWSLPGGKIEYNETYTDTLIREIKEELGINCKYEINKSLNNKKYLNCSTEHKKFRCYIFHLNENIKLKTNSPFEIAEIKWWNVNKLKNINKTKLLEYILNKSNTISHR